LYRAVKTSDGPVFFYPLIPEAFMITFDELLQRARAVLYPRKLSHYAEAGGVGAALLTAAGHIYTGVNIDTACGMGFCAEHAAAAAMLTAGEAQVVKMVALNYNGRILPPCGRCREFISQLHPANFDAEVLVDENTVLPLRALLPYDWKGVNSAPAPENAAPSH
jgi:cytidine deaminase